MKTKAGVKRTECRAFFTLALKLIAGNKIVWFAMGLTLLISLFFLGALTEGADRNSAVSVGLVKKDNSSVANEFVRRLKKQPSFRIYEGTEQETFDGLKKRKIQAIFVVDEDFEKKIVSGNNSELITIVFPKENQSAGLLSDIAAGELIDEICARTGYRLYQNMTKGSGITYKEYRGEEKKLSALPEFQYRFDKKITEGRNMDKNAPDMSWQLLYKQIIFCLLSIMLGFLALSCFQGFVFEKRNPLKERISLSPASLFSEMAGVLGAALCFLFGSILVIGTGCILFLKIREAQNIILFFLLLFLYGYFFCFIFWLLSRAAISGTGYQISGCFVIIFSGVAGFLDCLSGLLPESIINFIKILPNNWLMKGITAIILNENRTRNENILKFAVTAVCITGITAVIIKINERTRLWSERED